MQRSTYCSGNRNVDLREFGRKCQRAVLHSLIRENINNGDDIRECDWLEHLIREQNLQGKTMIAVLKSGCVGENRIANKLEMKYYNLSNQSAESSLGKHPRDDSDVSTDLPQKQLRQT